VTYYAVWDIQAVRAIDALADNPHPPNAAPLGSSGWYRLLLGPYRATYQLRPDQNVVHITNVGQLPPQRERRR